MTKSDSSSRFFLSSLRVLPSHRIPFTNRFSRDRSAHTCIGSGHATDCKIEIMTIISEDYGNHNIVGDLSKKIFVSKVTQQIIRNMYTYT